MKTRFLFLLMACFLEGMIVHQATIQAATYRCQDSSGIRILTDNPAQLQNCTLFQNDSSPSTQPGHPLRSPGDKDSPADSSVRSGEIHAHPLTSKDPTESPEEITIPLTKLGGSLIVQAQLNQERSAQLIVDTGASMTVLSTGVAIDLGILGTTDNELMTVNTAGGQVQVNVNYLTSLAVGEAKADHVAVAIHDLPDIPSHIEGLLGMSFLKHFLITLDAEHGYLILRPKQQS